MNRLRLLLIPTIAAAILLSPSLARAGTVIICSDESVDRVVSPFVCTACVFDRVPPPVA